MVNFPNAPPPASFYAVALLLSALTYYIGMVLLTIPVLGRGGKNWRKRARAMVIDSGYTLIAFLLFATPGFVLNVISAFGFPAGPNGQPLDGFYTGYLEPWLGICGGNIATPINPVCGPYVPGLMQNIIQGLVSILITVMLLYLTVVAVAVTWGILSALGVFEPLNIIQGLLGAVGSFITGAAGLYVTYQVLGYMPVITLAPAALFLTVGVYYLAEFVRAYWSTLMAWGAVIYILPLRFGRKAGAALIAISLVLYVALPAMPLFVGMLSNTGSAQQALVLMQQNTPDVQRYLAAYEQPDLYFALSSRGPQSVDYYALHIQDTSGLSWTIWSDKSGSGSWPLPTGSYTVTGVEYLGILAGFQVDQPSFSVEQAATNFQAPSKTASIQGLLDIYQFNLTKIQLTGSPAYPAPFTATFFLQMQNWRGAVVKGVNQFGLGSDSVNSTVCAPEGASSNNVMHGEIFLPSNPALIITNSEVNITLGGASVQLYPTGTQSRLGIGSVYAWDAPLTGCLPLGVTALSSAWPQGFNYARQNVDPTGYTPPQLNTSQQTALVSSLDDLTYYFAANIILPAVYVMVILTGLSIGLAKLIMGRQFG